MLRGRHRQRVAVDALLDRARAGRGGVLVLRGGPGSGKSALLDAARRAAAERATGGREVLLCVDDAHLLDDTAWLDDLVADLADEPVALLIATEGDARGLPWVRLDPLDHADSLRVLRDLRPGLPPGLADEVADLARGNPLALVELTRALTSEQIGGTAPPPDGLPADSSLRARFTARFHALPAQARFAAALRVVDDEVDDDTLARMPDLDLDAVEDARALLDGGPLARAALRDALPLPLRFAAHAALAGALDDGGRLVLVEAHDTRALALPFGLLPGFWSTTDVDLRPDSPLLPAAKWRDVLAEQGFTAPDTLVEDDAHSVTTATRPPRPAPLPAPAPDVPAGRVVVVAEDGTETGFASALTAALAGFGADAGCPDGDPAGWLDGPSTDVVLVLAGTGPDVVAATTRRFGLIRALAAASAA
ncbi:ATP-binding protein, partial [Saccharothrix sp. MB29]|nr:ATP-binding protein [Saccharothrix sp. MB29]